VLPVVLGAVGLFGVVVVLLAVAALRGLTGTRPTQAEAQAPPRPEATAASAPARSPAPLASARSPQTAWPMELVQQGKITAPDMSGRPLLFNANFKDSDNGFPLGKWEHHEKSYRDGKMRLTTPDGPGAWWISNLPGDKRYSNFACELVGRVLRPRSEGWACVLNGEAGHAARVSIDSDGALHVQTLRMAPTTTWPETGPLNRTFLHRAIKPRGEANTLLCIVRGRQLELYVNGVAVQSPITSDRDLAPTLIGCCVLGGADGGEVEFERITVWSVEDLPPPEARGLPEK
jgi:hypothetical protein